MKIALVSLNQKWENKAANLEACRRCVSIAKVQGADLAVFPEMTLTGFSTNVSSIAESETASTSIEQLKQIASENRIAIIAGVVLEKQGRPENTLLCIAANGSISARYAKIHPFSFASEDEHYFAGSSLGICDVNSVRFGFTICYDLRFPELYTVLGDRGCQVIVNIANWPARRIDHWHTLLRARAIENQIFVVGVNRIGTDGNGLEYVKSSVLYDANGAATTPCYSHDEIDIVDLRMADLIAFTKGFPTRQDRQPKLYAQFMDSNPDEVCI